MPSPPGGGIRRFWRVEPVALCDQIGRCGGAATGKTGAVPLPQLTPVTAAVGVVAAVWAGATVGLVAHTMAGPPPASATSPRTTYAVAPPPARGAAAAGSVPDRVESALAGGVSAGVTRTTQLVSGGSPSPSAAVASASPSPSVAASAAPSPPAASPAASSSPQPDAAAGGGTSGASPSPSAVAPSASASPTPRHGRAR